MTEQQGDQIIHLLQTIAERRPDYPAFIDADARATAKVIEDAFIGSVVDGMAGGREKRLARIQCLVRDAMLRARGASAI